MQFPTKLLVLRTLDRIATTSDAWSLTARQAALQARRRKAKRDVSAKFTSWGTLKQKPVGAGETEAERAKREAAAKKAAPNKKAPKKAAARKEAAASHAPVRHHTGGHRSGGHELAKAAMEALSKVGET